MAKPLILSTKILSPEARERILQADIAYVEYNAIESKEVHFEVPLPHDYVVLSSQNATKIVLKHIDWLGNKKLLCVGKSSEMLLTKKGYKTVKMAHNMSELIDFIEKLPKNASFLHFCGNQRLSLLATKMTLWKRKFSETVVYHTHTNIQRFESAADALLFFSPSAVKSHEQLHDLSKSICFCIGETTARAFEQQPKEIRVVTNPSIDLVVAKAVHYFKTKQHA
jgi:uroporphyrinogen-III synthase